MTNKKNSTLSFLNIFDNFLSNLVVELGLLNILFPYFYIIMYIYSYVIVHDT